MTWRHFINKLEVTIMFYAVEMPESSNLKFITRRFREIIEKDLLVQDLHLNPVAVRRLAPSLRVGFNKTGRFRRMPIELGRIFRRTFKESLFDNIYARELSSRHE